MKEGRGFELKEAENEEFVLIPRKIRTLSFERESDSFDFVDMFTFELDDARSLSLVSRIKGSLPFLSLSLSLSESSLQFSF